MSGKKIKYKKLDNFFKKVINFDSYINEYIRQEYQNHTEITVNMFEDAMNNDINMYHEYGREINNIVTNTLIPKALEELIKSPNLCLGTTNSLDYILPTGRFSYGKVESFSSNIPWNVRVDIEDSEFLNIYIDRRARLSFQYHLLEEKDGNVFLSSDNGLITTREMPCSAIIIYEYELSSNVYIKNIENDISILKTKINENKIKINSLEEKKQKLEFVSNFMKENNISFESKGLLKTKMILSEMKKQDNEEDITTQINDIVELEIN